MSEPEAPQVVTRALLAEAGRASLAARAAMVGKVSSWEDLKDIPDDQLSEYSVPFLRRYARIGLRVPHAYRIAGGKPTLVAKIVEYREQIRRRNLCE
jgi:hypothetical protein